MRLLADEHIPPAIVSVLRGEGHDIAVVGDDIDLGAEIQSSWNTHVTRTVSF